MCVSRRSEHVFPQHVHYITLHYITLHYIKLHYITLHCLRVSRSEHVFPQPPLADQGAPGGAPSPFEDGERIGAHELPSSPAGAVTCVGNPALFQLDEVTAISSRRVGGLVVTRRRWSISRRPLISRPSRTDEGRSLLATTPATLVATTRRDRVRRV